MQAKTWEAGWNEEALRRLLTPRQAKCARLLGFPRCAPGGRQQAPRPHRDPWRLGRAAL